MTHLDDEILSAMIDDQLGASELATSQLHLSQCGKCQKRLVLLKDASASFRKYGAVKTPTGLLEGQPSRRLPSSRMQRRTVAWAAVSVACLILGGVVARLFLPTLFNEFQQIITGAASSMGSGDK
jgi:anti-sigma factor RsiW